MSRHAAAGTARERSRDARRKSLDVLLGRTDRGVISSTEAALLRSLVGAEIAEGDAARRAAGGQQAAVRREQQRVAAAEAAIVEAEQRAEQAEQHLATARTELYDTRLRRDNARAGRRDAEQEARRAEDALARVREQLAESEEAGQRWANYLADAQRACGAPNWPALADTIRASIPDATRARARYREAWRSARRRALAAEAALAAERPTVDELLDQAAA